MALAQHSIVANCSNNDSSVVFDNEKVNFDDLFAQMIELQKRYTNEISDLNAKSKRKTHVEEGDVTKDSHRNDNLDLNGRLYSMTKGTLDDTLPIKHLSLNSNRRYCTNDDNENLKTKDDDYSLNRTLSAPPARILEQTNEKAKFPNVVDTRHECTNGKETCTGEFVCEESTYCLCNNVNCLRKSYQELEHEIVSLKRVNITYRSKLVDEINARQKLHSELDKIKSMYLNPISPQIHENGLYAEPLGKGASKRLTDRNSNDAKDGKYQWINSDDLRMKNRELERELKGARRTIKMHEQRLFLFSSQLPQTNMKLDNHHIHKPIRIKTDSYQRSVDYLPVQYYSNHVSKRKDRRVFSYCHDDIREWRKFEKMKDDDHSLYSSISSERYESLDVKPR